MKSRCGGQREVQQESLRQCENLHEIRVHQKDVKTMLSKQARSAYGKEWAAKHEYEELKEDTWLEPALAQLRKNTREEWTEKHRNVARKLVLEDGWVQKGLFDIDWRKAQKSTASTTAQNGTRSDGKSQRLSESGRQKARTSKEEWKWQRGIVAHPLSERPWNRSYANVKKWKFEKHKSWVCQQKVPKATLPLTALFC